jgi:hypothetical protein
MEPGVRGNLLKQPTGKVAITGLKSSWFCHTPRKAGYPVIAGVRKITGGGILDHPPSRMMTV